MAALTVDNFATFSRAGVPIKCASGAPAPSTTRTRKISPIASAPQGFPPDVMTKALPRLPTEFYYDALHGRRTSPVGARAIFIWVPVTVAILSRWRTVAKITHFCPLPPAVPGHRRIADYADQPADTAANSTDQHATSSTGRVDHPSDQVTENNNTGDRGGRRGGIQVSPETASSVVRVPRAPPGLARPGRTSGTKVPLVS